MYFLYPVMEKQMLTKSLTTQNHAVCQGNPREIVEGYNASQQEEMFIILIFATIVEKSKDNICYDTPFSNPVFTKSTQMFSQVC